MIAADQYAPTLLTVQRGALVAAGRQVVADAQDGAYSPDGTLLAFVRGGDLWLANSDGTGRRRLTTTTHVVESAPSWLPSGNGIVYTAQSGGAPQIRLFRLPTGPSRRLAAGSDAAVSATGRLAVVVLRNGAPEIDVGGRPFDPATRFAQIGDLSWSPDGSELAYSATGAAGFPQIVVDDGTTQTVGAAGTHPVWSPDGTRIAFATAAGAMSTAADGSDLQPAGAGTPVAWASVPTGTARFPNLVMRPPSGLEIERARDGHWLLGFTSMVDNRGPGVLWIRARRVPGAATMQVRQLIRLAGGGVRVDPPSGALHYVVAPPHYHWHLLGFVHAELRDAGDFALRLRDHKSGFCLADHYGTAIGMSHGPPRFLGNCDQFDPKATSVEEGESVGYTDRYPAFFHGQQLDLTGVPAGRYWLVHRANEDFHLRESRYDDNVASVLIRLSWHGGVPRVATLRSCFAERC
jgi:hypothetical protein